VTRHTLGDDTPCVNTSFSNFQVNHVDDADLSATESSWPVSKALDLAPYVIDEKVLAYLYTMMKGKKVTPIDRSLFEMLSSNMSGSGKLLAMITALFAEREIGVSIPRSTLMTLLSQSKDGVQSTIKSYRRHQLSEVVEGSGRRPNRYVILTPALS
jgi:hypothetical protein